MESYQVGEVTVLFTIGSLRFSAYGLILVIAALATAFVSYIEWRKQGYHWFHFFTLFELIAFFSLFGARWWYLAFNPADFTSLLSLFAVGYGRSILGAIFFTTLVIFCYVKFFAKELEYHKVIAIVLPNLLLGQAIGRWGNFFDHNIYGPIATNELSFLPNYIRQGMYISDDFGTFYRQPLFLYESLADFLGWLIILLLLKPNKNLKPGVAAGTFFFYYGTVRAILEPYRSDPNSMMHIGNVATSFIWAIIFAVIGLGMIIYYQFYFSKIKWVYKVYFPVLVPFYYQVLMVKVNFKLISSEKLLKLKCLELQYYFKLKNRKHTYLIENGYLI